MLTVLGGNSLRAGEDNGGNGLRIIHLDGSQDIYGLGISYGAPSGGHPEGDFALTRRIDPHGNTTSLNYELDGHGGRRLKTVIDIDGSTYTLSYLTTTTNSLIT